MKIDVKSYSTTSSLLSSIVFLVIGAFLITNADSVITWISYIIGGLLVLVGIIKLFTYYRIKKKTMISSNGDLIIGLILLAIGIPCFFLASVFETIVRFIIGAWILFSGVQRLVETLHMPNKANKKFLALLIISVLLMVLGLYIILYSNLLFIWVGILMVLYSILEITGYVFFSQTLKDQRKEEEPTKKVIIEHKEKE